MPSTSKLAASPSDAAQEPLKRGVARKFTRTGPSTSQLAVEQTSEQQYINPDNRIATERLEELDDASDGVRTAHPTPPTIPRGSSADSAVSMPAVHKPGHEDGDLKGERTSLGAAQVKSPASSGKADRSTSQERLSDSEPTPVKKPCKRKRADIGQVSFDGDGYSDESDSEEPVPKRRMFDDGQVTGLSNLRLACFSNAALQLLYSALSSDDVELLANGEKVPDIFDIDLDTLKHFDGLAHSAEEKQTLTYLRETIQEAAKSGAFRVSPYVQELLQEMRDTEDRHISPVLMQQVFAYHKEAYREFDGETMRDASEYLGFLLNVLFEECSALGELFQFQLKTKVRCTRCQYTESSEASKHEILRVPLPSSQRCSLKQALAKREESASNPEGRCSNCGKTGGVQAVEELDSSNMPANLLIEIGRLGDFGRTNKCVMLLDTEEVIVGGKSYRVQAIVKHTCGRATSGHYTAWRRFDKQWWKLDDSISSIMRRESDMTDGAGRNSGYASILLLKRNDLEA